MARAYLRAAARVVRWTLVAVVLIAAVVGLLFITRGTAVHRVRAVGADGAPLSPSEPAFPLSVALLAGTPIVAGNRVELALNGDGTFPRLWADLRAARRSITLQMYYLAPGRVADTLSAILEARAWAGVAVFMLYDAFGSGLPETYFEWLRFAGVRAVAFRPLRLENLWVVQNRSHVRGIVVDGRVGWTGGFGIDDKWLGGGLRPGEWRETNVRFEGPAVRQLEAAFVAGWTEATGELALSIAGARERLYVTNAYFAPDENFVALLTRAAGRGVDVRILVGGPSTDVRAARLAAHARYQRLLEAGVRVYEYEPTTLHAKTFVVDGLWVSVGTMNFDNRSLALNDESTLMVLDSAAGRRMEEVFLDDLRHSREIELTAFLRRPWTQRVAEWAANLITPLL